jgi:hypothetical protein
MKNLLSGLLLVSALFLSGAPAQAQQTRKSPHETISTVVDGSRVMIVYGRPYSKDPVNGKIRKIWGEVVPYGEVWRAGADEATLLITQAPLHFGSVTIPSGAYTLWAVPQKDGSAKLVINKQIGQWGVPNQYDEKQDLARLDLKKEASESQVDQFTMAISKTPPNGGAISLTWENVRYTIPFTVKK